MHGGAWRRGHGGPASGGTKVGESYGTVPDHPTSGRPASPPADGIPPPRLKEGDHPTYNKHILPAALAALVATGAAGGFAFAEERGDAGQDAAALADAKVTLQQAIATAEQQANGRAVGADIKHERGTARIEVGVTGPQGVETVLVDAQTGRVTATYDGDRDNEDDD